MNTEATESLSKIRGSWPSWHLSICGFILTTVLSLTVDGDLIEGPQNTTAHVGQNVKLRCVSNATLNLRWSYLKKSSSQFERIYNGDSVEPNLPQVFSVTKETKDGKGTVELQFNASESTAATYACFEPGTEMTLKAEVTLQTGFTTPFSNFEKVNSNKSLMVIGVIAALQMAIKKDWLHHLVRGLVLMNSNA